MSLQGQPADGEGARGDGGTGQMQVSNWHETFHIGWLGQFYSQ